MSQGLRNYLKVVLIAALFLYAMIVTSKFFQRTIHRTSQIKATAARQKRASGRYTVMKMNMSIPDDIRTCANKPILTPYKYDYNTGIYLPPPVSDLCRMTTPDLEMLYQRYLNSIQTICKTSMRFGKLTDGGWDVCVEPKFLPRNACLVYSFGINFDFSFDDDISNSFGCTVHSFDPSMKLKSHERKKDRIFFHDVGLADVSLTQPKEDEWPMLTFKDIRKELNHLEIPDVVKMDVEAWEWNVLPQMFATGQFPKQIILEFHLLSQKYTTQRDLWIRRLSILREIYDAGYRIFWMNRNLVCKFNSVYNKKPILACHEISFLRNEVDTKYSDK